MHKKFKINQRKIKGGCQSETKAAHCYSCTDLNLNRTKIKGGYQLGRKVVTHDSKSDLPLVDIYCL